MRKSLLLPLALVILAASIAQARVMIPRQAQQARQYFEIVREQKPCPGSDCFVEYIGLSNGLMIRKKIDSEKYDEVHPGFDVRRANETSTQTMFEAAVKFYEANPGSSGSFTDPNNLYLFDGDTHRIWSSAKPPAGFEGLLNGVAGAFDAAAPEEAFYLHAYYQPLTGSTQALHVFADGTIIKSAFDRNSYKMLQTSLDRLPPETLEKLRAMVVKARGTTPGGYKRCAVNTGLEYGVVEFTDGGTALKSYTCGTGDGDFPALFNAVKHLL